jgi:hypothetical protein
MNAKCCCVILLAMLQGCAAIYSYERIATDGSSCHVSIATRRDAGGPNSITIGQDCALTANTGPLTGGQISVQELGALLGLFGSLTGRPLPATTLPSPTPEPPK